MKRHLLLSGVAAALMLSMQDAHANQRDYFSQSYFSVRPQFSGPDSMKLAGDRDRRDARADGCGGSFQVTVFGGRSTNKDDVGAYFSPFGRVNMKCRSRTSSGSDDQEESDILVENFGVLPLNASSSEAGSFNSTLKFQPKQSVVGAGLRYQQHLYKQFSLDIAAPVVRVKNTMGLSETVSTTLVASDFYGTLQNMTQALSSTQLTYGRIDNTSRTKTRLAELEVKVNYNYIDEDTHGLNGHLGVSIPTGNKHDATYVFSPVVGNGKHVAIMSGLSAHMEVWNNHDSNVRVCIDTEGRYSFSNTQKRSFDLMDKRWGRYLSVYATQTDWTNSNTTNGINVFTKDCNVTPGISRDLNLALVYTRDSGIQAELGYHFFARQAEKAELKTAWENGPSLMGLDTAFPTFDAGSQRTTNRAKTINRRYAQEDNSDTVVSIYNTALVRDTDLDLSAAAAPAALSHTIYGSVHCRWDEREYPVSIGCGGEYEFSANNAALNRYALFGTLGVSF